MLKEMEKLNKTILKNQPEFCKGAFLAATLADDLGSDSRYRLSDRILLKLNLITKRQMKKKPAHVIAFDLKKEICVLEQLLGEASR
jgi:hypothetical protein